MNLGSPSQIQLSKIFFFIENSVIENILRKENFMLVAGYIVRLSNQYNAAV